MTRSLLLLAAATLTVSSALAQSGPPPAGQQHRMHGPAPAPTNLQVLPKTMTGEQVEEIMHHFTGDLGVKCGYCHDTTPDPATGRRNFASDANPMKNKARIMLKMTMAIDKEYLTQLTPAPENPVHCGTCHRGNAKPTVFVPPPDHDHPAPPPTPPAPGQ